MEHQDKSSKRKLPDSARAEKGLSLRNLLKFTPMYYMNNAKYSHVVLKRYNSRAKTKGGLKAITGTAVSMASKPPRTAHECYIIGLDRPEDGRTKPVSKQSKVLVSCNCDSFKYTFEYANWTWGASRIIHSNGEPASVTNPQNRPGLCIAEGSKIKILTEMGEEEKNIEDVTEGDIVLTLKGPNKVLAARFTGIRNTLRLVLKDSELSLRATPEHRILVIQGTKILPNWVELKDIKPQDRVVTYAYTDKNELIYKDNVCLKTVLKVGDGGTHSVYDLEVENAEHFVANNVVVHNCKHLVVLLKTVAEKGD